MEATEDRSAYSVEETAKRLGISRTLCWQLVRSGELPSKRFGVRVVVPAEGLRKVLEPQAE